jgi:hypothetical protein
MSGEELSSQNSLINDVMEKAVSEYEDIQERIYKIQQEISNKTTKLYMQVIAFFITVTILIIIVLITTTDIITVIKKYFERSKNISDKDKIYLPNDENKYEESSFTKVNEIYTAEQSIMRQHASQKDSMKNTIKWKKNNAIPDPEKVESQVDLRILEPAYDNYEYQSKNNGISFWKMLFMPPNYHKLIDSRGSPYHQFVNE